VSFKVKADDVDISRLAGGVYLRCNQKLETFLEAMGGKSVSNCVKALVAANRFAAEAREERGPSEARVARICFVPQFARERELQWMRLRVVALGDGPPGGDGAERRSAAAGAAETLKVGARTDLDRLQKAISAKWRQRQAGSGADPVITAMGSDSVSKAVKAAAFALRNDRRRGAGALPFMLLPTMETVSNEGHQEGERMTATWLHLQQQPRWGDKGHTVLTPMRAPGPGAAETRRPEKA